MYKLVVLDIDGTTLNDKEKLTTENFHAIQNSIKKGVPVCLCTGRNIHNTKRVQRKLQVKTPYVCIDGTVIYNPKTKSYIKNEVLDANVVRDIIKEIEKEQLYIELCTKDKYVKYVKSKELEEYEKYINDVGQLIFAGDKKYVDKVKEIIKSKKYENIEIKDDLWPNYVFISPSNCRKIDGVKALCEHYNIGLDEVITVGDQMNDFDMIKGAGMGVAMGNAHDKIKEIAKFTTLDNNHSGVAHVINELILKK